MNALPQIPIMPMADDAPISGTFEQLCARLNDAVSAELNEQEHRDRVLRLGHAVLRALSDRRDRTGMALTLQVIRENLAVDQLDGLQREDISEEARAQIAHYLQTEHWDVHPLVAMLLSSVLEHALSEDPVDDLELAEEEVEELLLGGHDLLTRIKRSYQGLDRAREEFQSILLRLVRERHPVGSTLCLIKHAVAIGDAHGCLSARVVSHSLPEVGLHNPELSGLLIECVALKADGGESDHVVFVRTQILNGSKVPHQGTRRAAFLELVSELDPSSPALLLRSDPADSKPLRDTSTNEGERELLLGRRKAG